MNFLTQSLFIRGQTEEDTQDRGGMLAVWGSPSSGKTTVSVKLAYYLASRKRDVILVLTDMTAPSLSCICPPGELETEHSLGSILAAAHVTASLVRQKCVLHKRLSHLMIIGMQKGENVFTYPPYGKEQAKEFLEALRELADDIIIDCGSVIASDILSAVALIEADSVLRLMNCDLKSISYLSSQLPLLKDAKWDTEKQLKVLSRVKTNEAESHVEQGIGKAAFSIPYSREVEEQGLAGDLFQDLCLKESRGFRKEIEKISREVYGI